MVLDALGEFALEAQSACDQLTYKPMPARRALNRTWCVTLCAFASVFVLVSGAVVSAPHSTWQTKVDQRTRQEPTLVSNIVGRAFAHRMLEDDKNGLGDSKQPEIIDDVDNDDDDASEGGDTTTKVLAAASMGLALVVVSYNRPNSNESGTVKVPSGSSRDKVRDAIEKVNPGYILDSFKNEDGTELPQTFTAPQNAITEWRVAVSYNRPNSNEIGTLHFPLGISREKVQDAIEEINHGYILDSFKNDDETELPQTFTIPHNATVEWKVQISLMIDGQEIDLEEIEPQKTHTDLIDAINQLETVSSISNPHSIAYRKGSFTGPELTGEDDLSRIGHIYVVVEGVHNQAVNLKTILQELDFENPAGKAEVVKLGTIILRKLVEKVFEDPQKNARGIRWILENYEMCNQASNGALDRFMNSVIDHPDVVKIFVSAIPPEYRGGLGDESFLFAMKTFRKATKYPLWAEFFGSYSLGQMSKQMAQ